MLKKQVNNLLQSEESESSETCKTLLNISNGSEDGENEKGATLDQINQSQIILNDKKFQNIQDSTSSANSQRDQRVILPKLKGKRGKKSRINNILQKEKEIDKLMMLNEPKQQLTKLVGKDIIFSEHDDSFFNTS